MANFKLVQANDKQVWSKEYTQEYIRESGFKPYMGSGDTSIIRMDMSLKAEKGSLVHFPYFRKLSGAGVTGSATLVGNEEQLLNYSTAVRVGHIRNAVSIAESESFRTELDVADVARSSLKSWSAEKLRDDLIVAGQSIIIPGGNDSDGNPMEDTYVSYAGATAAQRNVHLVKNADRTLFGNRRSNSTGVMATSLTNIDATQKLSAGVITMAKTMARTATTFKPRPYRSDATAGREWFVLFVGPEGFRDLQVDPVIYAANKDARPLDVDKNPIFQSGDLIYNGVIIREIPEMTLTGLVGASGTTQVGHAVLCGQSALVVAYGKIAEPRVNSLDFDHVLGVGITEIRGQAKFSAAGVQTGMVSIYHAAASDA